MLELERRGKLPADKAAILGELRRRGSIPSGVDADNPNDAHGLTPETKKLAAESMPWMADDINNAPTASRQNATASLDVPDYHPGRLRVGQTEPRLDAVPEWKQDVMGVVNKAPQVLTTVGTAAGMAASTPFGGTASPMTIPVAGAAGNFAGNRIKDSLASILLPDTNTPVVPEKMRMLGELESGATSAMTDAAGFGLGNQYSNVGGPAATLDEILNNQGTRDLRTKAADFLENRAANAYRKIAKPSPAGVHDDTIGAVKYGVKNRVDLLDPSTMDPIHEEIKQLGGQAREFAGMAERPVSLDAALEPVYTYRDKVIRTGMSPDELQAIDKMITDFKAMHPESEIPASQALEIRQWIDQQLNSKNFSENTFNTGVESAKALRSGTAKELQGAVNNPEFDSTMSQLGDKLNFMEVIGRSPERLANKNQVPFFSTRLGDRSRQNIAFAQDKLSDILRPADMSLESAPPAWGQRSGLPPRNGREGLEQLLNPSDKEMVTPVSNPEDYDRYFNGNFWNKQTEGMRPTPVAVETGNRVGRRDEIEDVLRENLVNFYRDGLKKEQSGSWLDGVRGKNSLMWGGAPEKTSGVVNPMTELKPATSPLVSPFGVTADVEMVLQKAQRTGGAALDGMDKKVLKDAIASGKASPIEVVRSLKTPPKLGVPNEEVLNFDEKMKWFK
jgi:hypothetical protein